MEHQMGLYAEPFNSIRSERKTVEVRLNDEKRRQLKVGDKIKFTRVPENDAALTVEITELRHFPTFKEIYEAIPASDFDTVRSTVEEMVEQTYEIYTPHQEKEWGTVAVTIELVEISS